jgi:methyl-accepting chemotaxis protein
MALISCVIGAFGIFFLFQITGQSAAILGDQQAELTAYVQRASIFLAAAIGGSVVLSFLLSAYISGMIAGPLCRMLLAAQRLEAGDLSAYMEYTYGNNPHRLRKDEIGKLGSALHNLIVNTKEQAQASIWLQKAT